MKAEDRTQTLGLWGLAAAGGLLIAAIGYASLRDSGPAPVPTPSVAAGDTIESLEARVGSNPDDAAAWAKLGELKLQNRDDAGAVAALERATQADPRAAGYWSALGEAYIYADRREPMPAKALAAFKRAAVLDPRDPRARYFLAVNRDLSGDHKGAIEDWLALLADSPPGAPWEPDLRRTIEQVGTLNKIEVADRLAAIAPKAAPANPGMPGPTADQVAAARSLTPTQQDEMARGMVLRLEARLASDPANLEGWAMLIRSRMTLNEPQKAAQALRDAVAANPGAKAQLEGLAKSLGVP